MKSFIVAGASGFVGSSLVKLLIKNNIRVVAISNTFENSRLPKSDLIECIQSDFSDDERLLSLLSKDCEYECFYNFAWRGVNGPEKAQYRIQLDNIALSLKCAELAKKLNCTKYLCAGTIAERAIESLPGLEKTSGGMMYGSAKYCDHIMLETYCKNIGLDFVWMQFSNIYGPENKTGNLISYTIGQLMKNEPATFGPAAQPYDFIFIDDLLEAVYRLGVNETKKNSYFIGSGQPRVLSEYLIKIGELAEKPELIQIGQREDDGIRYDFDMLRIDDILTDIGNYISAPFEEHIEYTIKKF